MILSFLFSFCEIKRVQKNKNKNICINSIYDIQIPGSNINNNSSSDYTDIYTHLYSRVVSLFGIFTADWKLSPCYVYLVTPSSFVIVPWRIWTSISPKSPFLLGGTHINSLRNGIQMCVCVQNILILLFSFIYFLLN